MKVFGWMAGVAGVGAALLLAQGAAAEEAAPKAEAKKRVPANFFGVDMKPADADAPPREAVITADKIDFDSKEGIILFDGNVLVDDAQFTMRADRLMVLLEGANEASQIIAVGSVVITNEMRHAVCYKAVYTKKNAQILMLADEEKEDSPVRMVTNGDTAGAVTGFRVVIWLDREIVEVTSSKGGQAKVVIPSLGTLNRAKDKDDGEQEKKAEP